MAKFPLAYKFSEGAGSVVTLVTLPGAHLIYQAFGKSVAVAVAAVPATPSHSHPCNTSQQKMLVCWSPVETMAQYAKGRPEGRPFVIQSSRGMDQKP